MFVDLKGTPTRALKQRFLKINLWCHHCGERACDVELNVETDAPEWHHLRAVCAAHRPTKGGQATGGRVDAVD